MHRNEVQRLRMLHEAIPDIASQRSVRIGLTNHPGGLLDGGDLLIRQRAAEMPKEDAVLFG
jgi:hypothetical protein